MLNLLDAGPRHGLHDHDLSSLRVVLRQGSGVEERMRLCGEPECRSVTCPATVLRLSRRVDIHRVIPAGIVAPGDHAAAYSPPLRRIGRHLIQPGGTLERARRCQ